MCREQREKPLAGGEERREAANADMRIAGRWVILNCRIPRHGVAELLDERSRVS